MSVYQHIFAYFRESQQHLEYFNCQKPYSLRYRADYLPFNCIYGIYLVSCVENQVLCVYIIFLSFILGAYFQYFLHKSPSNTPPQFLVGLLWLNFQISVQCFVYDCVSNVDHCVVCAPSYFCFTPYCQNMSTPLSTIFQQYRTCKSFLYVMETGVPGENNGHTASHLHNLSHKLAQSTLHLVGIKT